MVVELSLTFADLRLQSPQALGDPRLVAGDAGNTEDRAVEATALAFSTQ
jgi:hypothetical protein